MNANADREFDLQQVAHRYPPAATARTDLAFIPATTVAVLPDLWRARVTRSPHRIAYQQCAARTEPWRAYCWGELDAQVNRWRCAFVREVTVGARVAIRCRNAVEWVLFDQAALAQGLVVVPIYVDDRAENAAYILGAVAAEVVLVESRAQWQAMASHTAEVAKVRRVIVLEVEAAVQPDDDARVMTVTDWLAVGEGVGAGAPNEPPQSPPLSPDDLATIVYTSGTTGRPKGVMLSHRNILHNGYAALQSVAVSPHDQFLSFLPLSHMFERTVGYYVTIMAGARVAFNREIETLAEDLLAIQPTAMIAVPRIFERAWAVMQSQVRGTIKLQLLHWCIRVGWHAFEYRQGRVGWRWSLLNLPVLKRLVARKVIARFGGRLRFVIIGGAPLPPAIARVFIGLGIEILQGYGLTETSPVLSVNTLSHNQPASIGLPLHGVEIALTGDGELVARGDNIMQGYWQNPTATAHTITGEGWLKTGDLATLDADGFITITGRRKDIIVLANGEKIPPADLEAAISHDPLFAQVMLIGEGKPYLTALVVLEKAAWQEFATELGVTAVEPLSESTAESILRDAAVHTALLARLTACLDVFPGYAFVRKITATLTPWQVDNGLLTPTLKLKRVALMEKFKSEINSMYTSKYTSKTRPTPAKR